MERPGLKLILAVSDDGFLASGPRDDMRWTGFTDKQIFRLLTYSHPVMLVGRATAAVMPKLPHRQLVPLSRSPADGMLLADAARIHPNAWLIGGPTVALEALEAGLVDLTYLCRSSAMLGGGIPFKPLRDLLPKSPFATVVMDLTSTVEVFRRGP